MAKERVIRIGTELDTSGMLQGINKMRQMINSIGVDSSLFKDVDKDLDKITKLTNSIAASLKGGISEQDIKPLLKDLDTASKIYSTLPSKIRQVSISTNDIRFPKETIDRLDEIQLEIESLGEAARKSLGTDLKNNLRKAIPTDLIDDKTLTNITKADDKANSFINTITNIKEAAKESKRALDGLVISLSSPKAIPPGASARQIQNLTAQNANSLGFSNILAQSMANGTLEQDRTSLGQLYSNLGVKSEQVTKFLGQIDEYVAAQKRANEIDGIRQQVLDILTNANSTAADATARIAQLIQEQNSIEEQALQDSTEMKEEAAKASEELADANVKSMEETSDSVDKANDHLQRQDSLLKQLASRATSLIGIGAVFNYITRGVRDAWSKIKDLDKEFTSIAVVTDKTTSQLWQSFSTYSQMAQGLGIATKDAVATSALYYQQGLKTAEVMTLTAETIKMAQIAGMDFKTATNQMTAALRGFNLEMDQASMVNDIFSTLAANAAVDTKELSYALTKTASIAESAGMSIDTTSAFLAKMIETTREAPENIGTAMKSIVARFEELKKNPLALSVDVEGEEVVANKVEAAIALAGVKLRDETTGQFRDLDDVFLELAKSWEILDRNTQRYIATIAAGSRQQSRFIALMDGYDRTLELVELAQDSEGQSAAQFLKTLDSLDSKLNKISNSLESLYQKFVNSDFFGGLLDGLNDLLQKAGEMDAGQLASFLTLGVIIGNNLVKGFSSVVKNGSPFIAPIQQAIGGVGNKISEGITRAPVVGKLTNKLTVGHRQDVINKKNQSRVEENKNKIIKIDIDISQAEQKVDTLKKDLQNLENDKRQVEIDVALTQNDESKAELEDLNSSIAQKQQDIEVAQNAYENVLGESQKAKEALQKEGEAIERDLTLQTDNIKQSIGQSMQAVGSAMVTSLSLGITTALATEDPFAAIGTAMSAFALQVLPTWISMVGSQLTAGASSIGAAVTAAGGPVFWIIAAIGAAVVGLGTAIAVWAKSVKTDSQRLEEEIKDLQKKQKELEETSEKAQAEYAIENTRTKQLDKLIKKYDELIDKVNRTTDENEELIKIQNDLGQDFPDLLKYYDEAGNAVLKQRQEWQQIVDLQKESQQTMLGKAFSSELDVKLNDLQLAEKNKEKNQIDVKWFLNNDLFKDLDKEAATSKNVIDTLTENSENQRLFLQSLYQGSDTTTKMVLDNAFMNGKAPSDQEFETFLNDIQTLDTQEQSERLKEYMSNFLGGSLLEFYLEGIGDNLTSFVTDLKNLDLLKDPDNKYKKDIENKTKEIEEYIHEGIVKYTDTLLPSDSTFSSNLKNRISGTLTGQKQINYLRDINTPTSGLELQKIANIASEKGLSNASALQKLADDYKDKEISSEEYSKNTELNTEVQSAITEIRQLYLQELGELEVETLNTLKNGLSEENFELINNNDFENLSRQKIEELKQEISNLGIDTTFIDNIIGDFDKKISNWTPDFQEFSKKYGIALAESLINNKVGEKALDAIEKTFSGLESSKIPNIVNSIMSVDDWGNINNLYQIGEAYLDAGASAKEATVAVKELYEQFTNPFKVNLDPEYLAEKFKDIGESVQKAASDFKILSSALKEVEDNGKLSAQTITEIVAAGKIEYLAFDEVTKAVTINTQAVEDNWEAQMKSAEGTIDLDLQRAKTAIAGLEAQREIEQKKLDILESAAKKGGQITAEEYTQLQKLDNKYAIEVVDGQLNLNYDQLQNDATFFKDLFNNRTEMYNDLVNQAGYYGKQAWDAFLNHSQEIMEKGDYTAISSFASKWSEATLEKNKLSSKVRGSSNTAYYFDTSTLEQLTEEQRNKLELIDAEIKAWQGNIEKLEEYRNIIKEITGLSLEEYIASTADATKDANKELEDYISTLERYYTLQKRIEKLEDERQKALKRYKKTGSQEDLDEYISKSLSKLEDASRLAYVGKKDKERILPEAKEKLSKYFTKDELDKLQYDEYTGLLDLDSFYETKAYKAKTQDKEQGQKIDDILKDALSDTETAQGWIDAFEEERLNLVEEFEKEKEELEKIEKSIDRLQNVNRALESINKLLEDAKDDNDEYYATGGKEGISGLQYLRAEAQKITAQTQSMGEYGKYQEEIGQQLLSKDLMKYVDLNEGDNKLYLKPEKFQEYIGLLQTEDGQKLADTLDTLIEKYNSLTDATHDAEKAQKDEAKAMRDFAKSLRKSYSDLITRLADDMAKLDQKEIDEVKKKYQMIQDEDDKYLDALQKSIDKQRKLRDQAKSYDDLEKDEKRLALLERDTSGANAAEIAALREQIKDARQNLVDTEQDNIISNISDENSERKKKMDEETTFLQNVMDERTYDMQYYLDRARDIVDAAINGDAGAYQQLLDIRHKAEEEFFKGTAETQALFDEDLQSEIAEAQNWAELVQTGYSKIATSTRSEIITTSGTLATSLSGLSGYSEKINDVKEAIHLLDEGEAFTEIRRGLDDAIKKIDDFWDKCKNRDYTIEVPIVYKDEGDGSNGSSGKGRNSSTDAIAEPDIRKVAYDTSSDKNIGVIDTNNIAYKGLAKSGSPIEFRDVDLNSLPTEEAERLKNYQWGSAITSEYKNKYYRIEDGEINLNEPYEEEQLMTLRQFNAEEWAYVDSNGDILQWDGKKFAKKVTKFAEGGLVNYTGPAWVDGSPARPEAFLSVSDTRNIQTLTEVLSTLVSPSRSISAPERTNVKSGDTNLEIHIDVEQLADDYDVNQLLDVMQERISEASEGNVTIVK